MNCLFCNIIDGKVESRTLYENDYVKVFLDAYPESPGHMLIVPKKHITDFTLMDNETLGHINEVAKKMQKIVMEKLNPMGIRLVVNYGELQAIKHYHLHLIPYYKNKNEMTINEIENILNN